MSPASGQSASETRFPPRPQFVPLDPAAPGDAGVLDAIEPDAVASLHPLDLERLGVEPGAVVTVTSRRGAVTLYARADDGTPQGAVFIPFCFYEAAANLLTNPALDPFGKIPEFKYCAVAVRKGGELTPLSTYGGGQARAQVEPA